MECKGADVLRLLEMFNLGFVGAFLLLSDERCALAGSRELRKEPDWAFCFQKKGIVRRSCQVSNQAFNKLHTNFFFLFFWRGKSLAMRRVPNTELSLYKTSLVNVRGSDVRVFGCSIIHRNIY